MRPIRRSTRRWYLMTSRSNARCSPGQRALHQHDVAVGRWVGRCGLRRWSCSRLVRAAGNIPHRPARAAERHGRRYHRRAQSWFDTSARRRSSQRAGSRAFSSPDPARALIRGCRRSSRAHCSLRVQHPLHALQIVPCGQVRTRMPAPATGPARRARHLAETARASQCNLARRENAASCRRRHSADHKSQTACHQKPMSHAALAEYAHTTASKPQQRSQANPAAPSSQYTCREKHNAPPDTSPMGRCA